MVVWIIGLAGSGKTTVGREVHARLRHARPTVFLDGDQVREIMGNDLGHTADDRRANAWRICRLCRYLDSQGIDVVCAILSIAQEHRDWSRRNLSGYFEVFLDVPMSVLEERDQKGLYSGARDGHIANVVGVDIPFDVPATPDLVLANDGTTDASAQAQRIVDRVSARV